MTGIGSYLTAPLWLAFLVLGILVSLQAQFVRPEYFPKGFSLFPKWPAQDPVLAAWVFVGTMGMLILPKLLAYVVMLTRREQRKTFGGGFRILAGILAETFLSGLTAPVMMIFQSSAVGGILLGRDAGWQVQRRDDGCIGPEGDEDRLQGKEDHDTERGRPGRARHAAHESGNDHEDQQVSERIAPGSVQLEARNCGEHGQSRKEELDQDAGDEQPSEPAIGDARDAGRRHPNLLRTDPGVAPGGRPSYERGAPQGRPHARSDALAARSRSYCVTLQ
jgi:hypothetical protein